MQDKCKAGLKQRKLFIWAPRGVRDKCKAGLNQRELPLLAPRGVWCKWDKVLGGAKTASIVHFSPAGSAAQV